MRKTTHIFPALFAFVAALGAAAESEQSSSAIEILGDFDPSEVSEGNVELLGNFEEPPTQREAGQVHYYPSLSIYKFMKGCVENSDVSLRGCSCLMDRVRERIAAPNFHSIAQRIYSSSMLNPKGQRLFDQLIEDCAPVMAE